MSFCNIPESEVFEAFKAQKVLDIVAFLVKKGINKIIVNIPGST